MFHTRTRPFFGLLVAFGLLVGTVACGSDSDSTADDTSPATGSPMASTSPVASTTPAASTSPGATDSPGTSANDGTSPSSVADTTSSSAGDEAAAPSGTLRFATTSFTPAQPFPFATTTSGDFAVNGLMYEGLVRLDADGKPVPLLAESWESSADGKTITFKLLAGVQFSDGAPFNADAVKASLDFVRSGDERVNPGVANEIAVVESVEVLSDLEVAVHLSEPAQLQAMIGLGWHAGQILSPNALAPDYTDVGAGTGPYVFDSDGTPTDYSVLALEFNDSYRNPTDITLEAIEVTFLPDRAAAAAAYNADQFDVIVAYPSMGDVQDGEFIVGSRPATAVRLDPSKPELASRDVRCALRQAMDKAAYVQLQNQSPDTLLSQWAANDSEYAWIDDLDVPTFDLEAAKATLESQGTSNLELVAGFAPDPSAQDLLTLWGGSLGEIGVTLTPQRLESGAELYAGLGESRFPISMEYWTSPHPLAQLVLAAASDGGLSGVAPAPEGVDALIESARGKSHEDAEADIAAAYKIMLEECILGPVMRQQPGFWVHSDVTGFEPLPNPTSWNPLGVRIEGN
jgi:peptide/nickel transport system substrate-binding protein